LCADVIRPLVVVDNLSSPASRFKRWRVVFHAVLVHNFSHLVVIVLFQLIVCYY